MERKIKISTVLLPLLLSACEGSLLFHKNSCPEGRIQSGSVCVDATTTKASIKDCVDFNLSKVASGQKATMCDGSTGVGTYVASSAVTCTSEGQLGCVTDSTFKAANVATLLPSNIAAGKTIAGVTGTKLDVKQCRNAANLSLFDVNANSPTVKIPNYITSVAANTITLGWSHGLATNDQVQLYCSGVVGTQIGGGPVSTGTNYYVIVSSATAIQLKSTVGGGALAIASTAGCAGGTWVIASISDGIAQEYDNIDDFNGFAATTTAPSTSIWGTDYICNESKFTNVTGSAPLAASNTTPTNANQSWTQIWKDELTGLYLTNVLYTSGGSTDWFKAYALCTGLDITNGGKGGTGWRLPTQKESLQLYVDGISKVPLAGGSTDALFWSSTAVSSVASYAWTVKLSTTNVSFLSSRNITSFSVLCVR